MKNKISILIGILLFGYLVWNTVPKKIIVGEITYETMLCLRQNAFKKTLTLMHPKDRNVEKALEQMWKDYIHSSDPQAQEEYKQFVTKVVDGISEQLGPGYEVLAPGESLTSIFVTNLKKKAKEDLKVEKAMESIKNF